jgi:ceramide glucosyltransferase
MDWLIPAVAVFLIATTSSHLLSIAIAATRIRRNPAPAGSVSAAVTIIRPVCGLENFLEPTLRSTFQLDHQGYDVIFCAAKPTDPAMPLVKRLMAEHPHVPSRLLIGSSQISANPKLNNIAKGWDAAHGDWIVMADSNVLMPRDIVARLLATWRRNTGLVCSPPLGCAPNGF